MSRYYFLALCVLALFASSIVNVNANDKDSQLVPILWRTGLILLQGQYANAALGCLQQAEEKCRKELWYPKKLLDCAGKFIKKNKGWCLLDRPR